MGFLAVPGQQHEYDVRDVGDQDGTGVEHQSSAKQFREVSRADALLEVAVVDQQVGHAGYEIDNVGQQQVAEHGSQRRE